MPLRMPRPDFHVVISVKTPSAIASGTQPPFPILRTLALKNAMSNVRTHPQPAPSSVTSPIGTIPLQLGMPADDAVVQKLYDALDFQRASQAYLWAFPLVSFAEWQRAARTAFGARDTDMVIYKTIQDKLGILTANATTPYIAGFTDLASTGPLVIDLPAGATAGGVGDFWQRPLTDMGETGPDKGQGGRYLIVGPNQETPPADDYRIVRSPTNNIFVAFRVLDPDPAKAKDLVAKFRVYAYADRQNPSPTRFLRPEGRPWSQVPPAGFAYWERLAEAVQREPVQERDRMIMAMLKPLGIEKGKPFQPDSRQRKILEEGAKTGELMAQAISFRSREDILYRPDTRWEYVINFDPSQERPSYSELDERLNYFFQAVTSSSGMVTKLQALVRRISARRAIATAIGSTAARATGSTSPPIRRPNFSGRSPSTMRSRAS